MDHIKVNFLVVVFFYSYARRYHWGVKGNQDFSVYSYKYMCIYSYLKINGA